MTYYTGTDPGVNGVVRHLGELHNFPSKPLPDFNLRSTDFQNFPRGMPLDPLARSC